MSSLFPAARCDERFLVLMFLTRILLNAAMAADVLRPSTAALIAGADESALVAWMPFAMLSAAFALHASWMYGGVHGYLKRRAKAARAAAADPAPVPKPKHKPAALEIPQRDFVPASPLSAAATPLDSPLVTPYTPSQPSVTIRDNFFPNITMPTMPNLPIPAIPTLSGMAAALPQAKAQLNQLNLGLAEAVLERWEENRERLGRLRRRRAPPGPEDDEPVPELVG